VRKLPTTYHKEQVYTSPDQIFETFRFLQHETKEHFMTLHLDGKSRTLCIDQASMGSLNQSIVSPRKTYKLALQFGGGNYNDP